MTKGKNLGIFINVADADKTLSQQKKLKTEQRRRRKAMRRKVSLVIAGQKTESCFQQNKLVI
ncbi:hypothetical protein [Listeria monocytogenes]|uniref:hypothetical protein n=1 Tax=Listeria monocytogenes TaxID=1639 RepID=UPI003F6C5693